MNINKRIIDMCNARDWSTYDLAREAVLTHSTLNSMLQRGTPPKIETLQCICNAFGITLSQFFHEDEHLEVLTQNEKMIISAYRKLSDKKKQALLDFIM